MHESKLAAVGLLTGASGGIGSACARALVDTVDVILLVGRNAARLDRVASELGPRARPLAADLTESLGRRAILAELERLRGAVSWVVLAAGVALRGPLHDCDDDAIEATFAANVVGPALLLRRLLDTRWMSPASLVAIGSISAARALPNRAVYGATKAALEQLVRSLAGELAARGVRANVVSPGVIDTPLLQGHVHPLSNWVDARVPQARLGRPEEVAALVRYLITEAPEYLTGARLVVDGGAESLA